MWNRNGSWAPKHLGLWKHLLEAIQYHGILLPVGIAAICPIWSSPREGAKVSALSGGFSVLKQLQESKTINRTQKTNGLDSTPACPS